MSRVWWEDKAFSQTGGRGELWRKRLAHNDTCEEESTGNDMITGNVNRRQRQNRTDTLPALKTDSNEAILCKQKGECM